MIDFFYLLPHFNLFLYDHSWILALFSSLFFYFFTFYLFTLFYDNFLISLLLAFLYSLFFKPDNALSFSFSSYLTFSLFIDLFFFLCFLFVLSLSSCYSLFSFYPLIFAGMGAGGGMGGMPNFMDIGRYIC